MVFAHRNLLILLAATLPLLWLVWRFVRTRSEAVARLAAPQLVPYVLPVLPSHRSWVRLLLSIMGLALAAFALAGPRFGGKTVMAKSQGVDVVVAIDASKSMLARDIPPSRLERAKLELGELFERLKGDRVGLVVFAGESFVQCPLTNDYNAARLFLQAVNTESIPQGGTAVAAALTTAHDLIAATRPESADTPAAPAVVLLLTDGEDHDGDVDGAIGKLKQLGVTVHAVGVGSRVGEPIPMYDAQGNMTGYLKDRAGNTIMTRLNDGLLRGIAERTGGIFVNSTAADLGVGRVYEEIAAMQRSEFESRLIVRYEEKYQLFLFAGFILLVIAATMEDLTPVRRSADRNYA